MKKTIKKITPRFINELDDYLITHKPFLWCSRIHYYIYFEVLILLFTILLISFQSINYSNIPNTKSILIYSIIVNFVALVIWIVNQDLLKAKLAFGIVYSSYNLKVTLVFLFVFLLTANFIFIPYYYLNERAYGLLSGEPIFKIEPTNTPKHWEIKFYDKDSLSSFERRIRPLIGSSFFKDESLAETDSTKMDSAAVLPDSTRAVYTRDTLLEKYNRVIKSLRQSEIENISLIVGNEDLLNSINFISNLSFSISSPKFLILGPYDLRPTIYEWGQSIYHSGIKTLKVYYQTPVKQDSIYVKKFETTIYQKRFKGVVTYQSGKINDTALVRFYFPYKTRYYSRTGDSRVSHFLIADSSQLQFALIRKAVETSNTHPQKDYYYEDMGRSAIYPFLDIKTAKSNYVSLILVFDYIAIILSYFALLFYTIIRLFNIKKFIFSLILPLLFIGGCISLNYLQETPVGIDLFFLSGVFLLLSISYFITRFSVLLLNILVFCFYSMIIFLIYYLPQLLPFRIYLFSSDRLDSNISPFISVLTILILTPIFIFKLQKLYCAPK